ncbi:MAG: RidA family protein [Pseudomonadota bacterium]
MRREVIIPEGMENIHATYHYAPGILVGDTLYLSGQVGRDADLNVVEGTEGQFAQAFENVGKVLSAAGASFADVVELETWFADSMADLKTFLAVKDRYFTAPPYPTWTGFAVRGLSMPGILVEIKCKAVLGLTS